MKRIKILIQDAVVTDCKGETAIEYTTVFEIDAHFEDVQVEKKCDAVCSICGHIVGPSHMEGPCSDAKLLPRNHHLTLTASGPIKPIIIPA